MDEKTASRRVTRDGDGCYHWTYELDLNKNRTILFVVIKVLLIMCAMLTAFFAAMLIRPFRMESFLRLLGLCLLITAAAVGVTFLIYQIISLFRGGRTLLTFSMNEEMVKLVYSEKQLRIAGGAGRALMASGRAAGRRAPAAAPLLLLEQIGETWFENVRRVNVCPERDLLDLTEIAGGNQIFVCREDFDFVRDYILAHVPEKTWITGMDRGVLPPDGR